MTSSHNRLSPRDLSVIQTVTLFRQATSSQLRRLHFAEGSEASQGVKQRRTLARLVKWGELARIERAMGGYAGGSSDYIYVPALSRARTPDPHTLDLTELYVGLEEGQRAGRLKLLAFDPEPYCHTQLGHLELKPDAYVRLHTDQGTYRYWIELDRGTEWRPALSAKCRRYVQAYHHWAEDTFPLVLWITPDDMRARLVEGVIKRQEIRELFNVTTSPHFKDWGNTDE